jgi:hypothetical protein
MLIRYQLQRQLNFTKTELNIFPPPLRQSSLQTRPQRGNSLRQIPAILRHTQLIAGFIPTAETLTTGRPHPVTA